MNKICAALLVFLTNISYSMENGLLYSHELYTARSLVAQESHQIFRTNSEAIHPPCTTIEELKARLENPNNERLQHIKISHTIDDLTEIFSAQLASGPASSLKPYLTTLPRTNGRSTYLLVHPEKQQHTIIEHACLKNTRYYSSITGLIKRSSKEEETPPTYGYVGWSGSLLLTVSHHNNIAYMGKHSNSLLLDVTIPTAEGAIKSVYLASKELCCITHSQDDTYALHTFLFPVFEIPHLIFFRKNAPVSRLLASTQIKANNTSIPSLTQLSCKVVAWMIANGHPHLSSATVRLAHAYGEHPFKESIVKHIKAYLPKLLQDCAIQESLSQKSTTANHLNSHIITPHNVSDNELICRDLALLLCNQDYWLAYFDVSQKINFLRYGLGKLLHANKDNRTIIPLPAEDGASRCLVIHKDCGQAASKFVIIRDKKHPNRHYFAADHGVLCADTFNHKIETLHEALDCKTATYRTFTLSQPNTPLLLASSPDGSYLHTCINCCSCGSYITSSVPTQKILYPIEEHVHPPTGKPITCLLPSLTDMSKCRASYTYSHFAHNAQRTLYATLANDGQTIDVYTKDDVHVHQLALPKAHPNKNIEALFFHLRDRGLACLWRDTNQKGTTVHHLDNFDLDQALSIPSSISNLPLAIACAYVTKKSTQADSTPPEKQAEIMNLKPSSFKRVGHALTHMIIGKKK